MLRLLLVLWLTIATGVSAAVQPADQSVLVARAQEVVTRLVSGEVEPLLPTLTDKMKAAVDANGLRRLIPSLVAQFGAFKSQTGARFESQGVMRVVLVSCAFERANVEVRVAFDPLDRLGGLGYLPPKPTVTYSVPAYVTASAFRDEAFTIDAGGWPLQGILSRPVGEGPFPGVVLVHGSGPNDRDASIGPNQLFRDRSPSASSPAICRRGARRRSTRSNRSAMSEANRPGGHAQSTD